MNSNTKAYLDVTFHTPPKNQGQIVTVSFGADAEFFYRKTVDRSENSTVIEHCSIADAEDAMGDDYVELNAWEPWNDAPPAGLPWKTIEVIW